MSLIAGTAMAGAAGLAFIGNSSQAATVPPQIASSYQIGSTHDGISSDQVHGPWTRAWSKRLTGFIGVPIIANGIAAAPIEAPTDEVVAYHLSSGARAWAVRFPAHTSNPPIGITYDNGRVFVLGPYYPRDNWSQLTALSLATGKKLWAVAFYGNSLTSDPPVAYDGNIYFVGSFLGSTFVKFSETTRKIVWQLPTEDGGGGLLAVDASGVYYSYSCSYDGRILLSGKYRWRRHSSCLGGGGATPVVAGGSVYALDNILGNLRLSQTTGATLGTFQGTTPPLIFHGVLYTTISGSLVAMSLATGKQVFSFSPPGECLAGPPIAVDDVIYALTACGLGSKDAYLYGVTPSGVLVSTTELPFTQSDATAGSSQAKVADMTEGDGMFVIPGDDQITPLDSSVLVALKPAR